MLKLRQPKPLFLKASQQAVLLLHAYTSTIQDMKALAKFLHQHGYTCYAPSYAGHGLTIDELLDYTTADWWQDAYNAYQFLINQDYKHIAVIGVSLGAILSLKLTEHFPIDACISMSAPQDRSVNDLFKRLEHYAEYLHQFQNSNVELDLKSLENKAVIQLQAFHEFVAATINHVSLIRAPIFLLYGELDDAHYQSSAQTIYNHVKSTEKKIKSYPNTEHLMTLGKDQIQLFSDILDFLDQHHPI
ncbi:alpha/beta hydrolase [Acinetobacter guillouiae]|uniref:alpha/beta hydrolase n=1 Tax=Acinetobacter guillouiae TaxID=106649 RepID=UPI0012501311|nr:alpha/beta fold hydrolase [Acinetobacter guillouiae]